VNSEELELSLKAEFESYLSGVFAEMKQEVADFQTKIDAEFEKHKSQLDEAFKAFSAKFESERGVDKGFSESVVEHLRLARDDGAKLAATAFAEAEEMQRGSSSDNVSSPPSQSFDSLRNAINDITGKTSQSSILKALTDHCSQYAPRGAFFIIRNEHFVGWRVMGNEADDRATDIKFPISSQTLLSEAVNSLSAVESKAGAHADDRVFLDPLNFGLPNDMFAVPLVARGRGVAVLYVDGGAENASFNKEALETLVRVASLTVELLAASQSAKARSDEQPAQPAVSAQQSEPEYETVQEAETAYEPVAESVEESSEPENISVEAESEEEMYQAEAVVVEDEPVEAAFESDDEPEFNGAVTQIQVEPEPAANGFEFVSPTSSTEEVKTEVQPVEYSNGNGHKNASEPAVFETVASGPAKSPTRSWKVDLPIEVSEDERGMHNDARRFARLLVSEIKLYNEKQVKEGREANDLYDRLREAVDRSREMYEKRVKPPVASRFDYFHYELVNGLAEGDEARLGGSYPGSAV
jgi:hypothetical protein